MTAPLRRVLERLRRDDRGLSLAELLVTIMVFAIVLAVVSGTFVSLTRATSFANSTDTNVRSASSAMNEMTRLLHAAMNNPQQNAADAPAFAVATNESMTFTTAVDLSGAAPIANNGPDPRPEQVTLSLDSSRRLVETIVPGRPVVAGSTYYGFAGASTSRTLAPAVSTAAAGQPALFVYYDASNRALIPDATGALNTGQMKSIVSVGITLRLTNSGSTADNSVVLSNQVGLSNLLTTGTVGT